MTNAFGDDACFARARACHHQQRPPFAVAHRGQLAVVERFAGRFPRPRFGGRLGGDDEKRFGTNYILADFKLFVFRFSIALIFDQEACLPGYASAGFVALKNHRGQGSACEIRQER